MSDYKNTLIVVAGPTAIGKTRVGIALAQHFNTEIISSDSRQFYNEMNIGTAKPDKIELNAAKHHLIGQLSIHDYYNVHRFEQDALKILDDIFKKNSIAISVGGSGLYIDTLCNGIDDVPDADIEIRKSINQLYEEKGIDELQSILKEVDPQYYNSADLHNHKRLMRAVEVFKQTGKPYSSFRNSNKTSRPFNIIKIGLNRDRSELYTTINKRVDRMIELGLIEEAQSLFPNKDLNALNTVGYKELFAHFDGLMTLDNAIEKIKTNTRRYAKRQLTWFNKSDNYQWFHPEETKKIISFIEARVS